VRQTAFIEVRTAAQDRQGDQQREPIAFPASRQMAVSSSGSLSSEKINSCGPCREKFLGLLVSEHARAQTQADDGLLHAEEGGFGVECCGLRGRPRATCCISEHEGRVSGRVDSLRCFPGHGHPKDHLPGVTASKSGRRMLNKVLSLITVAMQYDVVQRQELVAEKLDDVREFVMALRGRG